MEDIRYLLARSTDASVGEGGGWGGGGRGGGGGGIQQETAVVPWNILPDVKVHVYAVVLTM